MKLLAWDTSSKTGTIVALKWDDRSTQGRDSLQLISEWTLNVEAMHSDRLLWGIHQVLDAAGWHIQDVDLLAVGIGPGSFTGLRIGVTTARTLAHTLGKPLIGVSSLAALARPAALWLSTQKSRVVIVASTDASKGELFTFIGSARSAVDCVVLGDDHGAGLWKRGVEESVLSPEELVKTVKRKLKEGGSQSASEARWIRLGEGGRRYPDAWKELPANRELEPPVPFSDVVQGRYLGLLAWEAYQAGIQRDPLKVHPRYLRDSDAEVKLRAGLLPKGPTRG